MGITGVIRSAIGFGSKSRRNSKRRIKPMSEKERRDSYQVFLKDITKGRRKSKNNYRLK